MAKITLPGGSAIGAKAIDERVEFVITTNLTPEQRASGVVAKVQVRHPAIASLLVTVWQKDGRKWVSEPSQKGKNGYFPFVTLTKEVKDYILFLLDNPNEQKAGSWYLDMLGPRTTTVTAEGSNPDLGIEAIVIDNNMTNKQTVKGMICKVNVVTTIGTLIGFTVWASSFGPFLYGTAPTESTKGEDDDTRRRGNPAYRLSNEGMAQVLNFLHPMVDFTAQVEVPEEASAPAAVQEAERMAQEGFQPVGDGMFGAGE